MMKFLAFILVATLCTHEQVTAQEISFPQDSQIPIYDSGIYQLDVAGIRPGDTVENVRKTMTEYLGREPDENRMWFALGGVRTAEFTSGLLGKGNVNGVDDYFNVAFSTPATGGQVVSVDRRMSFDGETAPRITELMENLTKKYGSGVRKDTNGSTVVYHKWYFRDGKPVECSADCEETLNIGYEAGKFDWYLKQKALPYDVRIDISVSPHNTFREKAGSVTLWLIDVRRRTTAAEADAKFLEEANEKAKANPGSMPKL